MNKKQEQEGIEGMRCFVVLQAVARKLQGVKTYQVGKDSYLAIFDSLEGARDYLADVIATVKKGISTGERSKNNLDPETSLDFLIAQTVLVMPWEEIEKRGWSVPDGIRSKEAKA